MFPMNFLEIPQRTSGNRAYGLTSIIDYGTPMGELKNMVFQLSMDKELNTPKIFRTAFFSQNSAVRLLICLN